MPAYLLTYSGSASLCKNEVDGVARYTIALCLHIRNKSSPEFVSCQNSQAEISIPISKQQYEAIDKARTRKNGEKRHIKVINSGLELLLSGYN